MVDKEKTMKLNLTAERIRSELFKGGFRPMRGHDFDGFCGTDEGSLMADIKVGRHDYVVIFSPAMGNVQIFSSVIDERDLSAWEMDLNTGDFINLWR